MSTPSSRARRCRIRGVLMIRGVMTLIPRAQAALRAWSNLHPEQRLEAQQAAGEARAQLVALTGALRDSILTKDEELLGWEDARESALNPDDRFRMAQAIVDVVRKMGRASKGQVAEAIGIDEADGAFLDAIEIAEGDGLVRQAGFDAAFH